jgi:hypothetical protein
LVDIEFLSNFAADLAFGLFLVPRCLVFVFIDLPHREVFISPYITHTLPPIGRPPSVHREGEGVLGRYLNGKQLGLSKKIPEKIFVKISEVTLIFL